MKQALLFSTILVVAMASRGVAAEPAGESRPAAIGLSSEPGAVLDNTTLWRHFRVTGPSLVRHADGALVKSGIGYIASGKIGEEQWDPTWSSPLPPGDWASPAFDDTAWPRAFLPQPARHDSCPGMEFRLRGWRLYDTAKVLVRGKFVIDDPARVKSCRLSLDYWGGVVVYVNGKEAARGHLPATPENPQVRGGDSKQVPAREVVPADYPDDAFGTSDGKLLRLNDEKNRDRLALRDRRIEEVAIPAALLRRGVNVLAVEVRAAPLSPKAFGQTSNHMYGGIVEEEWPPIGLLSARLTVLPAGAADRPRGIQVWNCAAYDTVTASDYGDPAEPLRPIVINAARNSVFSGRLMVGSGQPIKGLKVTVSDLEQVTPGLRPDSRGVGTTTRRSGDRIAASAVRVRYAVPAAEGKSWVASDRFDGLLDAIPPEIPVVVPPARMEQFYHRSLERKAVAGRAVAPLWFTVRVPKETKAGVYEGTVAVAAEGQPATKVPLRVNVSDWTTPDPQDFRIQNFLYHAEEATAKHYEVPNYSDKHFQLVGRSLALMAEVNSRQVEANMAVNFFAQEGSSNPESLVRWVKQPDGSFKHDFTNFDRYLDMVAKAIGKPRTLRLNCWGDCGSNNGTARGAEGVTVLDPVTGKIGTMPQPWPGTEDSLKFWRPVFDGVLKRLAARGWLDATTLGYNSYASVPPPSLVDVAHKLWPAGEWIFTSHIAQDGMKFAGPFDGGGNDCERSGSAAAVASGRLSVDTNKVVLMNVRHCDGVWNTPTGKLPPLYVLEQPRRDTFCTTARMLMDDNSPLREVRRHIEVYALSLGYDGMSEWGVDLFPLKRPAGGYIPPQGGRGTGWVVRGRNTLALLYPAPEGPVATERFEMFREGLELCEAMLYIRHAVVRGKLSPDLAERASRYLLNGQGGQRGLAMDRDWFGPRYMQAEEDAKLLDLAGEVAREMEGKK